MERLTFVQRWALRGLIRLLLARLSLAAAETAPR